MKYKDTKKRILYTALDLFSKNGYAGVSIRQIARSVGIRESAIYNHYKSKEDIFAAIHIEFKSKSLAKIILTDELLEELTDPKRFLLSFTKRLINHWNSDEERKFMRLLMMEQFTIIGANELSMTEYLNEFRSICRTIFKEMIKEKIIKEYDLSVITDQFTAPLFLIRTEYLSTVENKNVNEIYNRASMHIDFFWNAIKK